MKKLRKLFPVLFIALPIAAAAGSFVFQKKSDDQVRDILLESRFIVQSQEAVSEDQNVDARLPVEKEGQLVADASLKTPTPEIAESALPETVNLSVPFTAQAPLGNWKLPYQEACEEASLVMATQYLFNEGPFTAQSANKEILDLVYFVEREGFAIDITADETVEVAKKYYGEKIDIEAIYDFDENTIKEILAEDGLVIMPFSGRQLPNPHFRSPGPLYHMAVIKGYNQNGFIVNDPGTKFGANFTYPYNAVMNANHDWNNGNMNEGKKVMISIKRSQ